MQKQATQFTYEQLIERLGALVQESKKMILIVPTTGGVCIHSTSFNYKDIQRLTYILQRTPCEWLFWPVSDKLIGLQIHLFYR